MAYIAVKPVRFDKDYAVGELIPDGVVDSKMAASLEAMHLIVKDVKAVNNARIQFLHAITGADGDVFDYEAFKAQYKAVMGDYTGDAASFETLDQIQQKNGKITVKEAKDVFFNLPWVSVRFDAAEELKSLSISYTKDSAPGTFAKGNGSITNPNLDVITGSPTIAKGAKMVSYVLGDGAIETDASLGLTGDTANGVYAFTIMAVSANDETAKITSEAAAYAGAAAAKAAAAPQAEAQAAVEPAAAKAAASRKRGTAKEA